MRKYLIIVSLIPTILFTGSSLVFAQNGSCQSNDDCSLGEICQPVCRGGPDPLGGPKTCVPKGTTCNLRGPAALTPGNSNNNSGSNGVDQGSGLVPCNNPLTQQNPMGNNFVDSLRNQFGSFGRLFTGGSGKTQSGGTTFSSVICKLGKRKVSCSKISTPTGWILKAVCSVVTRCPVCLPGRGCTPGEEQIVKCGVADQLKCGERPIAVPPPILPPR